MGCGELSKMKKSQSEPLLIKKRISTELRRGETISTRSSFKYLAKDDSPNILEIPEKTCLKFRIFQEFRELKPQSFSLTQDSTAILQDYYKDINFIQKSWISFSSALSYFDLLTHGSCIENFKISDGALVLIVSCLASGKNLNSDILLHIQAPYILFLSVSDCDDITLKIIQAWQNLGKALMKFDSKRLAKIKSIVTKLNEMYKQHVKYRPQAEESKIVNKSKKTLSGLISLIKQLLKDVTDSHVCMREFVSGFKARTEEILGIGELANENFYYSGEEIVHYALSK